MIDGYLPLILGAAVLTYLTRVTGLTLGNRATPELVRVFLSFVPIAAFAALITPGIAAGSGALTPRLLGVAAAALVVIKFRALWPCLVAGMSVFWLSNWAM